MGFVSEDGIPYGSIDVNDLDSVEPKTDEAKAIVERLKAERDAGAEQVAKDEERLAEGDKAPAAEPKQDDRDQQGVPASEQKSDEKPAEQSKPFGRKASGTQPGEKQG
jgi:hypothetical protein